MKQKQHENRIAVRLPLKQRQQIDNLVENKKFQSISEVIRSALKDFLSVDGKGGKNSASK